MAKLNDFNFKKVIRKLGSDRSFPRALGSLAVNHFKDSFRDEGFTDRNLKGWDRRKVEDPGRGILTKSGDLKNSIRIIRANFRKIVVGTRGLEYAKIHNEGGPGKAWGRWPFTMKKRQFIGRSEKLEKQLKQRIKKQIRKAF